MDIKVLALFVAVPVGIFIIIFFMMMAGNKKGASPMDAEEAIRQSDQTSADTGDEFKQDLTKNKDE